MTTGVRRAGVRREALGVRRMHGVAMSAVAIFRLTPNPSHLTNNRRLSCY